MHGMGGVEHFEGYEVMLDATEAYVLTSREELKRVGALGRRPDGFSDG